MFIVRDSCQSLIFLILRQLCCHTVASRSPFLPAVAHIILEACHQLDAMLRWQSYSLVIGPQISPWAGNCGGIGEQKAANSQCKLSEPGNAIYDMLLRPSGTENSGTKDQSADTEEVVKVAALPLRAWANVCAGSWRTTARLARLPPQGRRVPDVLRRLAQLFSRATVRFR